MATVTPPVADLPTAVIGVLGGSGLYAMEGLSDVEELGFFLNKSCHNYGQLCERWWKPKDLLMLEVGVKYCMWFQ